MLGLTHVMDVFFAEIHVQLLASWESVSFMNGLFQCLVSGFLRFMIALLA